MKNYITIDGGTTNTRINLVREGERVKTHKIFMGAKDCIGGGSALRSEIKLGIKRLLAGAFLNSDDVCAIIASGMITSEYGLMELPHIVAPAGIKELHDGIKEAQMTDISSIPFYFIPGVKLLGEPGQTDMMRGEETEIFGILGENPQNYVYVLPGSHSKLILLDENSRISSFSTMLTGEMIAALSSHTILKDAVDLTLGEYDTDFLMTGYDYCSEYGINQALFKTRILKNLFSKSPLQTYSYFLGVVLAGEINQLKKCAKRGVLIGGKSQIKNAMRDILNSRTSLEVTCVPNDEVDNAVCKGAIKIFECE